MCCLLMFELPQKFHAAGFLDWTTTHAFFADMGGFTLEAPGLQQPIPLDAEQVFYLVQCGYVAYPQVPKRDLDDRNKSDGLSRSDYRPQFRQKKLCDLRANREGQVPHHLPGRVVHRERNRSRHPAPHCDDYRAHHPFICHHTLWNSVVLEG